MTIRPFATADLEAVATLHAISRRHAYAELLPADALTRVTPEAMLEEWRSLLAKSPDRRLIVSEESGRLLGFCMTTLHPEQAELNAIHVHPEHHGSGAATALHDEILAIMRSAGCGSAHLWVLEGNEPAQAFYRRNGWTFDGTRDSHAIGGADADILRYARTL
jgi:ribosomal protein S18 acetylase RimI-like enzyme